MAVNFSTSNPRNLLDAFKKAIDDGHVVTWSYDGDGDFTHTPEQWKNKAWLRPSISDGVLTLNFVANNTITTTKAVYGVYHGRFIESMLTHCDKLFAFGAATAMPTNSDVIQSAA
ncbi:hypothetical protein [Rhizobium laguerreae]|uniref:hypothetical protein n=1 Tax=Rhizobium laguerreae TaxID=1076926 RepID=UPI001C918379|nr:hypothetical protein [Rhizobium laguerreae]MBY3500178.1 hypothetical protein [Rhizobium laguerreae]